MCFLQKKWKKSVKFGLGKRLNISLPRIGGYHPVPSLSRETGYSNVLSQPNLAAAEQKFSEFRARWITRLDKCTDDWGLKTELLERLEDAYLAPVSDISERDFSEVKDMFFEGDLSPVRFLEELQQLLKLA